MAAYLHLYIDYDNPNNIEYTVSSYYEPELPTDHHGIGLHPEYLNKCDEVITISMGKIVRKVLAEME